MRLRGPSVSDAAEGALSNMVPTSGGRGVYHGEPCCWIQNEKAPELNGKHAESESSSTQGHAQVLLYYRQRQSRW